MMDKCLLQQQVLERLAEDLLQTEQAAYLATGQALMGKFEGDDAARASSADF